MRWRCAIVLAIVAGCGDDVASGGPDGGGDGAMAPDGGSTDGATAAACQSNLPLGPGPIIDVTAAQTADLPSIVAGAPAGATIRLAGGTYAAVPQIHITTPGLTITSAQGADVVVDGAYTTDEIISIAASDVTISFVGIQHAINHLVHVYPTDTADVTGVRLYGLLLVDGGEQFVKINQNAARTHTTSGGRVECSRFQMTDAGRPHVVSTGGSTCYTGGIDGHATVDWAVRWNRFDGIYCTNGGLAEHAIHFWDGSRGTLVEDNQIAQCARGVGFGLGDVAGGDHLGGIIRNNTVFADITYFDTGIGLESAAGARVWHNTVYSSGGFSSIDYRFTSTNVEIRNNLVRLITQRDGATGTVDHNLENVAATDFRAAAAGDLHLVSGASDAIDRGIVVADPGLDLDGLAHDDTPDLGAYEFRP